MQIIIIILCAYIVLSQILLLLVGEYESKMPLFWVVMFLFYPIGTLTSFLMAWHRENVEKRLERKKVKNNE